jgi:hypothetical protein
MQRGKDAEDVSAGEQEDGNGDRGVGVVATATQNTKYKILDWITIEGKYGCKRIRPIMILPYSL